MTKPITLSTPIYLQSFSNGDRAEFRARLVRAGRIRAADDSPGHFSIPGSALELATDRGLFDGPGWFENASVKALVGVTHSAEYNVVDDSVEATIKFYDDPDNPLAKSLSSTLQMMLADLEAGIQPPDIGISLTFWPVWQSREKVPWLLESFKKIDSADLVFGPAADGRILEVLSTHASSLSSSPLKQGGYSMSEPKPIYAAAEVKAGVSPADDEVVAEEESAAETVSTLTAWRDAAGQEAARSIIAHSQLPDISKDRLSRRLWTNPQEVYDAIEDERAYARRGGSLTPG